MAAPDFGLAIGWGLLFDGWGGAWWTAGANNVLVGQNPPYALADFAVVYPKFFGLSSPVTATTVAGSTDLPYTAGTLAAGQLIAGPGIPANTLVTAATATDATLSQAATATGANVGLVTYAAPLLPLSVLNAYIALASGSLQQARWLDQWQFGMALYVAHFATLWLVTEGTPDKLPEQMALAAAQRGLGALQSKSADGVSASYQPNSTAASWGSWGLTAYGVQLVQMAKLVGMGGMWIQG